MATIGRSTRQNAIWDRFEEIRAIVLYGLLGPDDGGYEGDDADALQTEWDALEVEYAAIHTANGTKG